MAYTLPEAIWLVRDGVTDDVLVAYPTVDRTAIAELAADPSWPPRSPSWSTTPATWT